MSNLQKTLLTLLALLIAITAHVSVLDQRSIAYTEAGLQRALVTFGISRGLNGVISVLQGTEVAIEPAGVGMTFAPGQILDPINDLVERFSTVVLFASTAFGIQRMALEVTSAAFFSICLSLALLLSVILLWNKKQSKPLLRSAVYKCCIVMIIIRFCIPVIALGGELTYQYFLAPQYQQSSEELMRATDHLNEIQQETKIEVEENSLFDKAKKLYLSASNTLNLQNKLDDFKQAAENISEHAIRLIVVFLFQILVIPILSVWLTIKLLHWVAAFKFSSIQKNNIPTIL